jgi:hypothetical protein
MRIKFSKADSNVNGSAFGSSQEPIKMMMDTAVEAFEEKSCLAHIFKETDTTNFAEKFSSMTSMGNFEPVGEGGAYPKTSMQVGYEKVIEPDTWKNSFTVTQEMMEDNKIGLAGLQAKKFTQSFMRTREEFCADLIGFGILGQTLEFLGRKFLVTGADGMPVFSNAHPSITEQMPPQSNRFAGNFSVTNLDRLQAKMQDFKDDNGKLLAVAPNTIVIPNDPDMKRAVFAAIGADKDPNSANNGFNFQFGTWKVCIWAYLNKFVTVNNIPWILLDSGHNEDNGGAILLDRIPLTMKSTIDDNSDDNIWRGRARFTGGFNDWRFAAVAGITGATAL